MTTITEGKRSNIDQLFLSESPRLRVSQSTLSNSLIQLSRIFACLATIPLFFVPFPALSTVEGVTFCGRNLLFDFHNFG